MTSSGRPWWVQPCEEAGPSFPRRVDALHYGPAYFCPECHLWHFNQKALFRIEVIEGPTNIPQADRLYYRENTNDRYVRAVHYHPAVQVKHFSDQSPRELEIDINDFLATIEPDEVIRVSDIMESHAARSHFTATVVYRATPQPSYDLSFDEAEDEWRRSWQEPMFGRGDGPRVPPPPPPLPPAPRITPASRKPKP